MSSEIKETLRKILKKKDRFSHEEYRIDDPDMDILESQIWLTYLDEVLDLISVKSVKDLEKSIFLTMPLTRPEEKHETQLKQQLIRGAIERIDSEIDDIWKHVDSFDKKMEEKIDEKTLILKDQMVEFCKIQIKEKENDPISARLPERFNVERCLNYLKKQIKESNFPQPEFHLMETTTGSIRAYLVISKDKNYFEYFIKFGEILNATNERYDIDLNISLFTKPEFSEIQDSENIQETSILYGEA